MAGLLVVLDAQLFEGLAVVLGELSPPLGGPAVLPRQLFTHLAVAPVDALEVGAAADVTDAHAGLGLTVGAHFVPVIPHSEAAAGGRWQDDAAPRAARVGLALNLEV